MFKWRRVQLRAILAITVEKGKDWTDKVRWKPEVRWDQAHSWMLKKRDPSLICKWFLYIEGKCFKDYDYLWWKEYAGLVFLEDFKITWWLVEGCGLSCWFSKLFYWNLGDWSEKTVFITWSQGLWTRNSLEDLYHPLSLHAWGGHLQETVWLLRLLQKIEQMLKQPRCIKGQVLSALCVLGTMVKIGYMVPNMIFM